LFAFDQDYDQFSESELSLPEDKYITCLTILIQDKKNGSAFAMKGQIAAVI